MEYVLILVIVTLLIFFLYFIEPLFTKEKIKNEHEHGSARWSTFKEIDDIYTKEQISEINEVGFPVYFSKDNKTVWFDKQTPHWIYLGSTGSGKSVTAVIPTCSFIATAKKKKSVFITDPKGEIFAETSKMFKDNGYKVLTLDFRNPSQSNKLNLLEPIIVEYEKYLKNTNLSFKRKDVHIYHQNRAIEHYAECVKLVQSLSTILMEDPTAKEKFWNNSASDLLYGLIFFFLEEYGDKKIKREQITLTSVKKFQNSSMIDKNLKTLKSYIETKSYTCKSKDKLVPVINTTENTYKSITSVFNEKMSLFDDINVENITSSSDFDFDILGKKPTVLYFCIPDEEKLYYSLVSLVVSLIYKTLVLLCNNQPNKMLPVQLVFLLDEFANTPPLQDIETIVSVARSRGMNFNFFIQSFAQLDNLYGKEVGQIIQDNCGLAYLKTNTQATAEEISKRLGNKTIQTKSLNYSMSFLNNNGSKNTSLMARPLMTADEIKLLHFKTIIMPTKGRPVLRDTVIYNKFSCYQKGTVEREIRALKRMGNTYYTVEMMIENEKKKQKSKSDTKTKLKEILNKIKTIFGAIDMDIEFEENEKGTIGRLFIAPPYSNNDIFKISELSEKMNFEFTISDKTGRKNRASKIDVKVKE